MISRRSYAKLIETFSNPSLCPVVHTNQNPRRIVWFFLVCGLSNQQRKGAWTWVKPKDQVLGGFKQKGYSSAARTRQGNGGNQSWARSLPDSNMTSKAPNIAEENGVPQFVLTIPQRHYDIMGYRARRFSVKMSPSTRSHHPSVKIISVKIIRYHLESLWLPQCTAFPIQFDN